MGNRKGRAPRKKRANNYKHIRNIKIKQMMKDDESNDNELNNQDVSF